MSQFLWLANLYCFIFFPLLSVSFSFPPFVFFIQPTSYLMPLGILISKRSPRFSSLARHYFSFKLDAFYKLFHLFVKFIQLIFFLFNSKPGVFYNPFSCFDSFCSIQMFMSFPSSAHHHLFMGVDFISFALLCLPTLFACHQRFCFLISNMIFKTISM